MLYCMERRIKVADGSKVVSHMTLKEGDYPGLSGSNGITGLLNVETGERRVNVRVMRCEIQLAIGVFEGKKIP